jgi:hypothetical protein
MGASKTLTVRTFVLDRLPARMSWFPLYEEVLRELENLEHANGFDDVNRISHVLRRRVQTFVGASDGDQADAARGFPLDKDWRMHANGILRCWKALEIVHLDRRGLLREAAVSFPRSDPGYQQFDLLPIDVFRKLSAYVG